MCPLLSGALLAHLSQCKASAKQQVNSLIDAIYAKVLLDLELWLNKHESNHSVHGLVLNHNEPTHSNDSIKSEIDSDWEENASDHNLPGESQFEQATEASNDQLTNTHDHHNNLLNEVSLTNTFNTESIIKQEFDDEEKDGEEIDDDNATNCEKCEKGICTSVDDDDYYECGEGKYLNQSNCANGVCNLDHENNNYLNNDVSAEDCDEGENENEDSNMEISSSTSNQITNIETDQKAQAVIIEPNDQQSTQLTSGVLFSTRKQISKKFFNDNHSNDDVKKHKIKKSKRVQSNKSVKKANDHGHYNSDESMVIQQEESDANNAIGEESEDELTTNPIQPNLAQPNRHLQCSHCRKSFNHQSKLQRHLRVHTGERPFQCDQCDKQFSQKHHLNSHLRTHSGERPFECRHCDMSFTKSDARTKHEQAIHLHVKPYRCKQCGHTATQRSDVIKHIRVVHFGLPESIKEQRALNIVDERDPRELLEKV